jgi:hypothetical protein
MTIVVCLAPRQGAPLGSTDASLVCFRRLIYPQSDACERNTNNTVHFVRRDVSGLSVDLSESSKVESMYREEEWENFPA